MGEWFLTQVAPVVVVMIGMTAASAQAIEKPKLQSSENSQSILVEAQETPKNTSAIFQTWTDDKSVAEWQISDVKISNPANPLKSVETNSETKSNQLYEPVISNLSQPSVVSFHETEISITPIAPSELEQVTLERRQIAQAELPPESDTLEDAPEPILEPEETPQSPRWQFTFTPYGFVPLSVDGSATVRDFTGDINLGLDDLLDSLNFAAAGRVEAWRGNLGFIFDGAYFNVGQESSASRSVPNCLCNIFPSEIDTEVDVQYGQFDLGVGYRVAANSANAANEFELGPLVFDAIVGVRIYAIQQEIDISTNVGTDRNLERSNTIVTPMASGRFRWNVSPTLAGWVRGDVAGFGIGGTLLAVSVTGGLDWMFSGNTSLLLAYRISSLQYTTDIRGEDFELDLLMQGPYMGVVFRF
ncbi:MAG: hypothetical protein Kow00121_02980 [Elainellaceae cyanobacterium]